ncbi:hypothetical protein [Ascidiaceihabitans sp.]|uniref:hypothetical protein n=2 Tax=Ascidiaceihabitans sp. TaxID=1872644 RepID=UPI003299C899
MRKFVIATSIALVAGNLAFAQQTQQTGVVGPSGDDVYSLEVTGADGATYNCRPDVIDVDGVPSRPCVQTGNTPAFQGSLAAGGGAALGALVFIALVSGSDGSPSTTTTTN